MRATVRATTVSDTDHDGAVLVRFMIGPQDGPGEESFDVTVCTTGRLAVQIEQDGRPILGRHLMIVDRIDLPRDVGYLTRRFEQVDGRDWPELARKLSRIGYWEFEDYAEAE